MVKKLTDKYLASLKPGPKPIEVRDTEVRGLTFRIQPSGVATFFLQFRDNTGKQGRVKIGRYGSNVHSKEIGLPRARSLAKEHLAKITMGENPADERREAREAAPPLTLREFLDGPYKEWAKATDGDGKQHLKSHETTLARLHHGFTSLLEKPLSSLTQFDFETNRQARLKSKSKSKGERRSPKGATLNRDQAHMRAALARAVKWGMMEGNPMAGVTKAREDRNAAIRPLSLDEEKTILETFAARRALLVSQRKERIVNGESPGPMPKRYLTFLEPLFCLSVDTGLRRGEALSLTWSDVDFDGRTINVRGENAKSSQSRTVPLSPRAESTLRAWRKQVRGQGRVFPHATPDALKGQWTRLLRDAKISGLRWHDLRHTFGSRTALGGASIEVLKKLMGHSSITTTSRYLHSDMEDARRAIDAMAKTSVSNVVAFPKQGKS